ncbi:unknown [Roseburia sp. CAG:309]|nr:unknown [Roseburia sp. CAG:309]
MPVFRGHFLQMACLRWFDGSFWNLEKLEDLSYDEDQVFTVKRYCSVIVVEYFQIAQENDCKVEILVDGEVKECLELYWEFVWNNRLVRMILSEQKAGWHTIEVRPAGGRQNDWEQLKQFDIKLGIGCLIEDEC